VNCSKADKDDPTLIEPVKLAENFSGAFGPAAPS
jgi:hypothetical protein